MRLSKIITLVSLAVFIAALTQITGQAAGYWLQLTGALIATVGAVIGFAERR